MILLNGKKLARETEGELSERVARIRAASGHTPILATILVGDDPASATYVRMKGNACRRIGMDSRKVALPESTTTEELLETIAGLNRNPEVHGILLQHPVPAHIEERSCFDSIAIAKDVDGVTSQGFGLLAMGESAHGSATPSGIMALLAHYGIDCTGKHAVVVGRSPILGKPMAAMLLNAHATVTVCHSRTSELDRVVGLGDIVVGAVGKPHIIRDTWIRDGAIVVDAGYHPGGIGDIEPPADPDRLTAYSPVPGGVGPMTISALIRQTVNAAEQSA